MRRRDKLIAVENANKMLNEGWVSAGGDGDEHQEKMAGIREYMINKFDGDIERLRASDPVNVIATAVKLANLNRDKVEPYIVIALDFFGIKHGDR